MKYDYKFLKNEQQEQQLPLVIKQNSKQSSFHNDLKKRIKFLEKKEEARKYPTPRSLSQRIYYWERNNENIPKHQQYHDSTITIEPSQLYFLKQGDWNGDMETITKETVNLSARSETPQSYYEQKPIKIPKLKFTKEQPIQQLGEVQSDRSNSSSQKSALTIARYQRPLKADHFYHVINRLKQDIKPERVIRQQCFNEAFRILEEVVPASIVLRQNQGVLQQFSSSSESEIKIEQQKKQKTYLSKGERVKACIMQYIRRLKRCKLTHAQVVRDNVFSSIPYSKENSQKFFQAIKENKEMIVNRLLQKTPYLVYDFDNAQMTGLHWAAKRGFANLVKILISYNADVDAKDIVDRTPLYIATDYAHGEDSAKYIEIIQVLLYNQAYPWSYGHLKYSNVIRDDKKVKELFAVSRKIHLILLLTPPQLKDFIWTKEVPAMTAIKNVSTYEEKQNLNQFELLKGNPHMDPRLKQFYTHKLIFMKRKVGNQAYQDIDKQIQNEQAIFEYVKKHPFQTF